MRNFIGLKSSTGTAAAINRDEVLFVYNYFDNTRNRNMSKIIFKNGLEFLSNDLCIDILKDLNRNNGDRPENG